MCHPPLENALKRNRARRLARRVLKRNHGLTRLLLHGVLRVHTASYRLAGRLATLAEHGVHPKHRLLQYEDFFVDRIAPASVILDIGCGDGTLVERCASRAARAVGVDINPASIAIAVSRRPPNVQYVLDDARAYVSSLTDGFDCVTLSNVLEHLPDRIGFLRSLAPHTGRLLIRVPRFDRDWITLFKRECGEEWRLDPTHCTEYTVTQLTGELEEAGFELREHRIAFDEIWAEATRRH